MGVMSGLGFLAPAAAWLFALLGPLVVFYFLKLKRQRLEVPSLVLWRRVLEDHRVNSPFQRFRRNILLILQILLLCLLALAAMQPIADRRSADEARTAVLIDCSASMGATDDRGITRLQEAKDRAIELIEGMHSDMEMAVIAFSNTARQMSGFSDNPRILRDAVEAIEVEDVPSRLEDALRVAEGLNTTYPYNTLVILSDGNLPEQTDFQLPFEKVDYQRLRPAAPNVGITALNARRGSGGRWDVLVQVEASGAEPVPATVRIEAEGYDERTETVSVQPGTPERIPLRLGGEEAVSLTAEVEARGDSLESDNRAWLEVPPSRPVTIYVPTRITTFRRVLRFAPDALLYPDPDVPAPDAYDVVISDDAEDLNQPARIYLMNDAVPPDVADLVEPAPGSSVEVVDWDRRFPLLDHVVLDEMVAYGVPVSRRGVLDVDFEDRGYQVAVHGDRGPMLLHRRSEGRVHFYLTFDTDRSTLPLRVGFPVMVSNLIQVAASESGLSGVSAHKTGVLTLDPGLPAGSYRVKAPGGGVRVMEVGADGILSGVPAPEAGIYEFDGPGSKFRVGVALLDESETLLQSREALQLSGGVEVEVAQQELRGDRPFWRLLAAVAFGLLLVEWWYYNHRPGG